MRCYCCFSSDFQRTEDQHCGVYSTTQQSTSEIWDLLQPGQRVLMHGTFWRIGIQATLLLSCSKDNGRGQM